MINRQPDPDDPVLDFQLVLERTRRHLPSAGAVTAVDESGGEARTYAIDADYIFKTQRPHRVRPRTSLEKEACHLRQLAANFPDVNVPRVLGYGRADAVEYILMTRMPGVPMQSVVVEGAARRAVLSELGSLLRQLHSLPAEPLRTSGLFPGDRDSMAIQQRLESDLQRGIAAATAEHTAWTLDRSPGQVGATVADGVRIVDQPPVPLHSNPGPEHVFVDPRTLRLSGLIDFGDGYLSHPALDMRRWSTASDRAALMRGYEGDQPLDDTFHANWRAISVTSLMLDFALRPTRRAEALDGLRALLAGGPVPGLR